MNSSNLKLAVDTEVTSYEKSLNIFDDFNSFVRSSAAMIFSCGFNPLI